MEGKGVIRYNKDIWTLITGAFVSSAEDLVSYELDKAEMQLLHGINVFEKSAANRAAYNELKHSETNDMLNFLERLVNLLGVDMVVAYDLLRYYVVYEFRGSMEGMQDMISIEGHKIMLIQDIWLFYRSERMFLLKCINFLWTYFTDTEHKFQKLYADLLSRHSVEETFVAFANQMVTTMTEYMPTANTHGRCMTDRFQTVWFISNMREQIQAIHNMIVYLDFYDCTGKEFEDLFTICMSHSFGYDCDPPPSMQKELEYFREIIGHMETIVMLLSLNLKSIATEHKLFADPDGFYRVHAEMEQLGTVPVHGPLLLAWLPVYMSAPFLEPEPAVFTKHAASATKLEVFTYLTKLLRSNTFQNSSKLKKISFECVEDLMTTLVDCFAVKSLVPVPGLFDLTATLLTDRAVTARFWKANRQAGLWPIVTEAMKAFPRQFVPFVGIVEALASCGYDFIDRLMMELGNLPSYMEPPYTDSSDVLEVTSEQPPTDGNTNATFPEGTRGTLQNKDRDLTLGWDFHLDFFLVLVKEETDLLNEISRGSNYVDQVTLARALAGVKCLYQLVENQCEISSQVSQAIAVVFQLMEKFAVSPNPSGEVLAACLDVAAAMLASRPDVVCRRLTSMKFLPAVDISRCTDPAMVARGDFFYLRTIGFVVANNECVGGKYPLLLSYLRFVDRVMQPVAGDTIAATLERHLEIILPCLVFVVTTVFPNYDSWAYESQDLDRATIAHHCIRLLHQLMSPDSLGDLSMVMDTLKELPRPKDNVKKIAPYLLHQTALFSLLETDTSVALIKVVGVGDRFIQELMERQPDWLEGCGVLFTNNVIIAMSVLNRVLLYRSTFGQSRAPTKLTNIELLLLSQPPSNRGIEKVNCQVRVINVIANYIFHSFNPKLPIMAVKLFKRFASEFSISLLSCLGPDGRQICQQFLFRLNSSRESIDLKVAILELMAAGIVGQPGLSEAFLNLSTSPREELSSLDYICKVLDQLRTNPEEVAISIHHNVISLIYSLWTTYAQRVLNHLRIRESFWDGLCAPFFLMPVSHEIAIYYKLLSIFTLEMFWFGQKMASSLARSLKIFLGCGCGNTHFARWSQFVCDSFAAKNDSGVVTNDLEELALAWKNFLTVLINRSPFPLQMDEKKMIVADTMKMMLAELISANNQVVIRHLADLMLILITNWKKDCFAEATVTTGHLHKMLVLVSSSYPSLTADCKESLLALALRLSILLTVEIQADEALGASVLHASCQIASTELMLVNTLGRSPPSPSQGSPDEAATEGPPTLHSCLCCTISVCLVEKLVFTLGGTDFWTTSLMESRLPQQLMDVAQFTLGTPALFDLAEVTLDLLLLLSYTDLAKTLVTFKVGSKLWLPLVPTDAVCGDSGPWFVSRWSDVYKRAVRLVTRLLDVQEHHFVADAVSFVGIHEPYIVSVLLGIHRCLQPDLMRLALVTLQMLQTLQQYGVWKEMHPASFYNINRCVVSTLDRCIAFFLQPCLMSAAIDCPTPFEQTPFGPMPFWTADSVTSEDIPDLSSMPKMAPVINRLLECINLCMAVLLPLGPSFLNVMTDILDTEVPITPLVQPTFEPPAVENDPQGQLTLGTLMSVISLCTRAITQKAVECGIGLSPVKGLLKPRDKYLSALAPAQLAFALEMSLSLMLSQTLVAAADTRLPALDRHRIMLMFTSKMSPHIENVKRFVLMEDMERLTPSTQSPEKALGGGGGSGGGLKRGSDGGRNQCSRRLLFVPSSPAKRSILDADDPVDPIVPIENIEPPSKGMVLKVAPRYELDQGRKHSSREYVQMMMILYQSAFQSAFQCAFR